MGACLCTLKPTHHIPIWSYPFRKPCESDIIHMNNSWAVCVRTRDDLSFKTTFEYLHITFMTKLNNPQLPDDLFKILISTLINNKSPEKLKQMNIDFDTWHNIGHALMYTLHTGYLPNEWSDIYQMSWLVCFTNLVGVLTF